MNTYEKRTLNKANFLLNKFKLAYKRYPQYATYYKWLEETNQTAYPFKYELKTPMGTSASNGGHTTPVISIGKGGKKSTKKNLAGVLAIKAEIKNLFGKEPTLDQLATGIALYTIHFITKPNLYAQIIEEPPPVVKEVVKVEPPKQSITTSKPQPVEKKVNIVMPDLDDDDDWESLCD